MTNTKSYFPISVQDYLAGELVSEIRHEYVAGAVYALTGGSNTHSLISSNCLGTLFAQLSGTPCIALGPDTKIRINWRKKDRFYYPDVSVVCDSNAPDETFQENPVVVVEVLSASTRRTDEVEKMEAYLSIPSLSAYLLVEQDSPAVTAYHRTGDTFERAAYGGLDATISLDAINVELPLKAIYQRVQFANEQ